jgi:hypothetical protein
MEELNLDKYAGAFICLENGVYFLGFHSQLVHGQTMPFYKDADKARSRCRFSSTLLARRMLGLTDPSVRAEAAYEVDTVPQMGPGGAAVFRLTKIEATP